MRLDPVETSFLFNILARYIRALLPDLIKFSYIPQNDLRINENSQIHAPPGGRDRSPDFTLASWSTKMQVVEPEEHVLVLEFAENSKGKKNENYLFVAYSSALNLIVFMM